MRSEAKSRWISGKKLLVISFWLLVILGLVLVLTTTVSENAGPVVSEVITYTPPNPNPYHKLYEDLLYPSVRISTPTGIGSGVVITNTNATNEDELTRIYILSAAHVVGNQSIVDIEFYNSEIITGTVIITDTIKDLSLICVIGNIRDIRVEKIYSAKLAPRDYKPYLFTPVYAVGCSLGLDPRPSSGEICAICGSYWEISAPILPGNSGGGVYDAKTHKLIGITVWVRVYNGQLITTMAGVVPISTVYDFIEEYQKSNCKEQNDHFDF